MSTQTITRLSEKVEKLVPVVNKSIGDNQKFVKNFLKQEKENNTELKDLFKSLTSQKTEGGNISGGITSEDVQPLLNKISYQKMIIDELTGKVEELKEENDLATEFLSKLDKNVIIAALGGGVALGIPSMMDGGGISPGMEAEGGAKASPYIYSGYGQRESGMHHGVDISGGPWQPGVPISVIKPGEVHATGDHGNTSWGKHVVIRHDDGTFTLYGHLSSINVSKGQKIENKSGSATVIGRLGSSGRSTGPHLHFELGNGWDGTILNKVNPAPHIDSYVRAGGNVKTKAISQTSPVTTTPPASTTKPISSTNQKVSIVPTSMPSGVNNTGSFVSNSSQQIASVKPSNFLSVMQFHNLV